MRHGNTTDPDLWHKLKPIARQMRCNPTPAEDYLWQHIRARRLTGAKFRRQHSIERFIVDFVCLQDWLVIEVDGPIHDYAPDEDAIRQEFIEAQGFQVLRFTNDEVLNELEKVLDSIRDALTSPPDPLSQHPKSGDAERGGD